MTGIECDSNGWQVSIACRDRFRMNAIAQVSKTEYGRVSRYRMPMGWAVVFAKDISQRVEIE